MAQNDATQAMYGKLDLNPNGQAHDNCKRYFEIDVRLGQSRAQLFVNPT
jgi:hypothetical protein